MGKIQGIRRKSVRWVWVMLLVIQLLLPGVDSLAELQAVKATDGFEWGGGELVLLYGGAVARLCATPLHVTEFEYGSNVRDGRTGWELTPWAWPSGLELVRSDFIDDGVRLGDVDGLRDRTELFWKSDPMKADTDGDGIDDALEVVLGLDPDSPDSDGDGLGDCVDAAPADPADATEKQVADGDLNRDCHLDAGDVLLALRIAHELLAQDPTGDVAPLGGGDGTVDLADALVLMRGFGDVDLDGDGVSVAGELAQGMSPFLWDSDGDGRSDAQDAVGDAGGGPSAIDRDGDGLLDIEETLYGSDPDDPDRFVSGFRRIGRHPAAPSSSTRSLIRCMSIKPER